MPKLKKVAVKEKKQKLTPEQRSDVAKERWAKRRQNAMDSYKAQESAKPQEITVTWPEPETPSPLDTMLDAAVASASEGVDRVDIMTEQGSVLASREVKSEQEQAPLPPAAPPVEVPAPQLAPVRAPKPKRYTGPKEFSVALKAAENRLAKAIVERAEAAGKLAALQAEIPSLMGIIQALKGSGNYTPPATYDFTATAGAQVYQAPPPQYPSPLDALHAAQPTPPVSRAQGGAIQFSPDVLGSLEGPDDDDDPDKYITGPLAGGGWK